MKMRTVKKLKHDAAAACRFRGHKMGPWGFTIAAGGMAIRGGSICKQCSMSVQYDTSPPPNGIDIGGEAVALNCPGKST